MEGVTILSTWHDNINIISMIVVSIVLFIVICCIVAAAIAIRENKYVVLTCVIMIVFICILGAYEIYASIESDREAPDYMRVTVDEYVSFIKFMDTYEIVSREGNEWIVTAKN